MSKSLGNTLSLLELLDTRDPRSFRLQVLQSHYRSPLEISGSSLAAASAGVERLDAFAREFANARGSRADQEALERFRARMDDDLDTPGAVAVGFDLLRDARAAQGEEATAKAAAVFEIFEQALGLPLRDVVEAAPPEALAKAAERDRARAEKQWARADELRAELQAEGWIVEDGPDGTTIRR